jgi:hypothetical protein
MDIVVVVVNKENKDKNRPVLCTYFFFFKQKLLVFFGIGWCLNRSVDVVGDWWLYLKIITVLDTLRENWNPTMFQLKMNKVKTIKQAQKHFQSSFLFPFLVLSLFFFVFLIIISSQMMTNPNVDEVVTL